MKIERNIEITEKERERAERTMKGKKKGVTKERRHDLQSWSIERNATSSYL